LIAVVLTSFSLVYLVDAATTTMSVIPSFSNVAPTDVFNVNIIIADVANLTGWEFKLFYLKAIVNCSAVAEGPFLKSGGSTFKVFNITNNYNSTHGRILAACALLGANVSVTGTGMAALITFKALAPGNTPLDLVDTKLSDEADQPISHIAVDGAVQVSGTAPDVAITFVEPFKTVVGKSYTCTINVSTENQGVYEVTFNVTTYANDTPFASAAATVAAGDSNVVTLTWNTALFAYGNYTLKGVAGTLPGETDTADNTYTSVIQVHVGVPGDVSGPIQGVYDKIVNMRDISYMILLFNTRPTSPNWNPNVDVNNDGVVNMRDISIAIINFNKHE
jgi:hypothetical protein